MSKEQYSKNECKVLQKIAKETFDFMLSSLEKETQEKNLSLKDGSNNMMYITLSFVNGTIRGLSQMHNTNELQTKAKFIEKLLEI